MKKLLIILLISLPCLAYSFQDSTTNKLKLTFAQLFSYRANNVVSNTSAVFSFKINKNMEFYQTNLLSWNLSESFANNFSGFNQQGLRTIHRAYLAIKVSDNYIFEPQPYFVFGQKSTEGVNNNIIGIQLTHVWMLNKLQLGAITSFQTRFDSRAPLKGIYWEASAGYKLKTLLLGLRFDSTSNGMNQLKVAYPFRRGYLSVRKRFTLSKNWILGARLNCGYDFQSGNGFWGVSLGINGGIFGTDYY